MALIEETVGAHVLVTFQCGHKHEFMSPGVFDPAGLVAERSVRAGDGNIYVKDVFPCHSCQLSGGQMQVRQGQN